MTVEFIYSVGQPIWLKRTGEYGNIRGRLDWGPSRPHQYSVAYTNGAGCHTQDWFDEDDLSPERTHVEGN